ncbi:MAG TPA: DUF2169 domain-containing protein [Longimicrobiales bacterium]|nr:DUF2169 domain-containing protein [Longimicrobiales bacterium]
MDFENQTDLPADMMVGSTSDREMLCIVAAKATYRVDESGLDLVVGDEAWPVFEKPFEFRGVALAPDLDYRKRGTDVLVFGNAVAPGGDAVPAMWVGLESGELRYRAAVYGDRTWVRSGDRLVPSAPVPFEEMPLGNDRAFGGIGVVDGQEMPHPVNPDGRGFYLSEEEAEDRPLPNLERPDALIGGWLDRPKPACFLPPLGSLGLDPEEMQGGDPMEAVMASIASSFNQAVPDLVTSPGALGDTLRLEGFFPEGTVVLPMPPRRGPDAVAAVGDLTGRFPTALSSLIVLAAERVYVATWVSIFRYLFRPREKRSVVLMPRDGAPAGRGN